jgi:hypothetical protein
MKASQIRPGQLYVVAGFVKGADRHYAWRRVGARRKWFEVDFSDQGVVRGIKDRPIGPSCSRPNSQVMIYGEQLKALIRHLDGSESSLRRVA